jgi:hypothetical protein
MAKFEFIEWLIEWLEQQRSFTFEWDDGNSTKSLAKHAITIDEAESVFMQPEAIVVLGQQISPRVNEPRFGLFGLTLTGKRVFVCFTMRGTGIRLISVRQLNRKESDIYDELR